jgi:hypothetical protein
MIHTRRYAPKTYNREEDQSHETLKTVVAAAAKRRKFRSPSQWMRDSQRRTRAQHHAIESPSHATAIASLRTDHKVTGLRMQRQ